MTKPLLPLALLLSLATALSTSPPEPPSGEMVLDEVADGLRKYSKERDAAGRYALLDRLARTGDSRVALVLGGNMALGAQHTRDETALLIAAHSAGVRYVSPDAQLVIAARWWRENGAGLRRCAGGLPY